VPEHALNSVGWAVPTEWGRMLSDRFGAIPTVGGPRSDRSTIPKVPPIDHRRQIADHVHNAYTVGTRMCDTAGGTAHGVNQLCGPIVDWSFRPRNPR